MIVRNLFLLITLTLTFLIETEAAKKTGTIIDTIECKDQPEFSYALYLPEKYNDSVSLPVIYIFDPWAQGTVAISNFIPAAELYGYILAASNNSRNGLPEEEYVSISNYMMSDLQTKYHIDSRRIYTSGFSGGSRVAAMIALKNETISGVIGCGAGFSLPAGTKTLQQFDYYGLVGDCDMNLLEMTDLKKRFDNTVINFELRIFEGGHKWPSSDLLQEAVEWLELLAIHRKYITMNAGYINYLFQKSESLAQEFLKNGKIIESCERYNSINKWFSGYINTDHIKEISDSIQQTKEFSKALKKGYEIHLIEKEFQMNIISEFKKAVTLEELPDSMRIMWMNQIASIRRTASSNDESRQKLAKRQLNFITILSYETARNYSELKSFKTAAIFYQIVTWIQPEDSKTYYLLAQTYALDKDLNKSAKFLSLAVKKGYNNREVIESDTTFRSFLNEKKFREILEQCK